MGEREHLRRSGIGGVDEDKRDVLVDEDEAAELANI